MRRLENNYDLKYSFTALKEFLQSKGWNLRSRDDYGYIIFSPADAEGKRLKYLLPEEKSRDFLPMSLSIIEGISSVERTTFQSTVDEFKEYLSNSLVAYQTAMKLKFGDKDFHVISLQESEDLARNTRTALAHAIDNEIKCTTYRRKASNQAIALSQDFQVGHQKGSFVYVVKSPLVPFQTSFENIHRDLSLSSRGIVRIAKGMQWMSLNPESVEDLEELTIASSFGFNANIAEYLSQIFKSVSTPDRFFMFNINSEYAKQMNIDRFTYKIGNKDIENLEKIYEVLSKPKEEVYVLKVAVTKLHSENPKQASAYHKVTVKIEDGSKIFKGKKIVIDIPVDLYFKALKAHENDKSMTLTGRFQVIGTDIDLKELKSLA